MDGRFYKISALSNFKCMLNWRIATMGYAEIPKSMRRRRLAKRFIGLAVIAKWMPEIAMFATLATGTPNSAGRLAQPDESRDSRPDILGETEGEVSRLVIFSLVRAPRAHFCIKCA